MPASLAATRAVLRRADRVVFHSRHVATTAGFDVSSERAAFAPMPLLPAATAAALGPGTGLLRVVAPGNVRRYKGGRLLLRAWERVEAEREAELRLAGELYSMRRCARAAARRARPGRAVVVTDRYLADAEILDEIARADLVALPYGEASQSGWPPLCEHFGVPWLAAAVGGLAEQLTAGRHGVPWAPGGAASLAKALSDALRRPVPPDSASAREDAFRRYAEARRASFAIVAAALGAGGAPPGRGMPQ